VRTVWLLSWLLSHFAGFRLVTFSVNHGLRGGRQGNRRTSICMADRGIIARCRASTSLPAGIREFREPFAVLCRPSKTDDHE
jgi:hypothetical protein